MAQGLRYLVVLAACCWAMPVIGAPAEAASKTSQNDYDLYKILVDSIDQVERNYVTEVDRRDLIESAIRGVLSKLDPYSSYIGPNELERFHNSVASEFGGIGIQISMDEGQLTVISPIYGSPAYREGVLAGDRILEIDGKSTEGLSIDESIKRLKGDEGTVVALTVMHSGKDAKETISLTREIIHVDTVLGGCHGSDGAWEYVFDPQRHIGYVRIVAFSRDTPTELQRVLTQLQTEKLQGLILDLRFNPGGLLSAAIEVSNLFVSEGRIVSTKGRNSAERTWNARKEGVFQGFPMVVLVNRYSASASEIVAACLQDHHRAIVIGERTWGKGSVQNVIDLEDGKSALKLTTASYRRPNGKNIHRFPGAKKDDEWGVAPNQGFKIELSNREMLDLIQDRREGDILHAPSPENVTAKKPKPDGGQPAFVDRQLQAAVKYLNTELAKAP